MIQHVPTTVYTREYYLFGNEYLLCVTKVHCCYSPVRILESEVLQFHHITHSLLILSIYTSIDLTKVVYMQCPLYQVRSSSSVLVQQLRDLVYPVEKYQFGNMSGNMSNLHDKTYVCL